jgi:hypothetical protein
MTHALITFLAADEKSKTPFYVIGGAFAVWAVCLAIVGLRNPDFPSSPNTGRLVMGVSVLLAVASATAAVVTA